MPANKEKPVILGKLYVLKRGEFFIRKNLIVV